MSSFCETGEKILIPLAMFDFFTEARFRVEVFWVMTPCGNAGYQRSDKLAACIFN
jgi:ribonuclease HI